MQHNGSNTFWYSLIWILPEMGFAAVAIVNSGEKKAFEACDRAIANFLGKV